MCYWVWHAFQLALFLSCIVIDIPAKYSYSRNDRATSEQSTERITHEGNQGIVLALINVCWKRSYGNVLTVMPLSDQYVTLACIKNRNNKNKINIPSVSQSITAVKCTRQTCSQCFSWPGMTRTLLLKYNWDKNRSVYIHIAYKCSITLKWPGDMQLVRHQFGTIWKLYSYYIYYTLWPFENRSSTSL